MASGCFWGREYHLRQLPGAMSTSVGFAGGTHPFPTYAEVCGKNTGHAEAVRVVFDTRLLSPKELLVAFLELHDATVDRRGQGGQYRSAVFVMAQEPGAETLLAEVSDFLVHVRGAGLPVTTEVGLVDAFYPAAGRHQQYCASRGLTPKRHRDSRLREILTAI